MTERPANPRLHDTDDGAFSPRGSKPDTPQDDCELPRGNRRIAELAYRLLTEGQTPRDQAVAVGIGVFIGCIPVFGAHIFMVLAVASLTRLSRVRMYAATWISNPFFAPVLVWAEFQVGHLVLTGRTMDHSVQQLGELGVVGLGWTLIVGAVVVGVTLGILVALAVWTWIPRGAEVMRRRSTIEAAAHRYLDLGLLPWFQVREALYRNPAMADLVTSGKLDPGDRIVDLGCGQGELLALVLEAAATSPSGSYVGITSRPQWAARARRVLPDCVEVEIANPAEWDFGTADSVVVWHARRRDAPHIDDKFIKRIRGSLNPNGLLIMSWPKTRLFDHGSVAFDHILHRLEARGFSIEYRSSSTAWYRRWNMILARA
jgi:uncharacterized protein (DUF2062 family)